MEWVNNGRYGYGERVGVLEKQNKVWGYGFFWNVEGRSWQGWDEKILSWFERHWGVSFLLAGSVVVIVGRMADRGLWWVGRGE